MSWFPSSKLRIDVTTRFNIKQVDPVIFKEEIKHLWRSNLPETPDGRLQWMQDNPEGHPVWFLAFSEDNNRVIGSISIMPRKIWVMGMCCLAGIVGDMMVETEYRVFGPSLSLMKTVVKNYSSLGFSFLYTFPNSASEKLSLRAGFRKIGVVGNFRKYFTLRDKLERIVHPLLSEPIYQITDCALKLLSKEIYVRTHVLSSELKGISYSWDSMWTVLHRHWQTLGNRDANYIRWKYFKNTSKDFKIYVYHHSVDNTPLGYAIFTAIRHHAYVSDLLALNKHILKNILARLLKDLRALGYHSVSIRLLDDNPLLASIRTYIPLSSHAEDFSLLFFGDSNVLPRGWIFYEGDRNI
jgi:hypothetical protein